MLHRVGGARVERRQLQLMVQRPEGMFVKGLRRQGGIPVPQCVTDALRGEAVDVRDAAPLVAEIKVRCPIEKPVAMQDGRGMSDGSRVAFRDGAVSQELGRIVRTQAKELSEEFKDLLFGRVTAREFRTALRGCLRARRHAHHYLVPST